MDDKENIKPASGTNTGSNATRSRRAQSIAATVLQAAPGPTGTRSRATSHTSSSTSSSSSLPATATVAHCSCVEAFFKKRAEELLASPCECDASKQVVCDEHVILESVRVLVAAHVELTKTKSYRETRFPTNQLKVLKIVDGQGNVNPDGVEGISTYITLLCESKLISTVFKNVALNVGGSGSSSGGSSLQYDLNNKCFVGRPGFDPEITAKMPVKPTQHRRHIIAWHHIREFANLCHGCQTANAVLTNKLTKLKVSPKILENSLKAADSASDASKKWTQALYLMNSCHENLWPGSGRINVSINAQYHAIMGRIAVWHDDHDTIGTDLTAWQKDDQKFNRQDLVQRAKRLVGANTSPLASSSTSSSTDNAGWSGWVATLVHNVKTEEGFRVNFLADMKEYAHRLALTNLMFDFPPGRDVNPGIVDAVEVIYRIVVKREENACKDAGKIFDALLGLT